MGLASQAPNKTVRTSRRAGSFQMTFSDSQKRISKGLTFHRLQKSATSFLSPNDPVFSVFGLKGDTEITESLTPCQSPVSGKIPMNCVKSGEAIQFHQKDKCRKLVPNAKYRWNSVHLRDYSPFVKSHHSYPLVQYHYWCTKNTSRNYSPNAERRKETDKDKPTVYISCSGILNVTKLTSRLRCDSDSSVKRKNSTAMGGILSLKKHPLTDEKNDALVSERDRTNAPYVCAEGSNATKDIETVNSCTTTYTDDILKRFIKENRDTNCSSSKKVGTYKMDEFDEDPSFVTRYTKDILHLRNARSPATEAADNYRMCKTQQFGSGVYGIACTFQERRYDERRAKESMSETDSNRNYSPLKSALESISEEFNPASNVSEFNIYTGNHNDDSPITTPWEYSSEMQTDADALTDTQKSRLSSASHENREENRPPSTKANPGLSPDLENEGKRLTIYSEAVGNSVKDNQNELTESPTKVKGEDSVSRSGETDVLLTTAKSNSGGGDTAEPGYLSETTNLEESLNMSCKRKDDERMDRGLESKASIETLSTSKMTIHERNIGDSCKDKKSSNTFGQKNQDEHKRHKTKTKVSDSCFESEKTVGVQDASKINNVNKDLGQVSAYQEAQDSETLVQKTPIRNRRLKLKITHRSKSKRISKLRIKKEKNLEQYCNADESPRQTYRKQRIKRKYKTKHVGQTNSRVKQQTNQASKVENQSDGNSNLNNLQIKSTSEILKHAGKSEILEKPSTSIGKSSEPAADSKDIPRSGCFKEQRACQNSIAKKRLKEKHNNEKQSVRNTVADKQSPAEKKGVSEKQSPKTKRKANTSSIAKTSGQDSEERQSNRNLRDDLKQPNLPTLTDAGEKPNTSAHEIGTAVISPRNGDSDCSSRANCQVTSCNGSLESKKNSPRLNHWMANDIDKPNSLIDVQIDTGSLSDVRFASPDEIISNARPQSRQVFSSREETPLSGTALSYVTTSTAIELPTSTSPSERSGLSRLSWDSCTPEAKSVDNVRDVKKRVGVETETKDPVTDTQENDKITVSIVTNNKFVPNKEAGDDVSKRTVHSPKSSLRFLERKKSYTALDSEGKIAANHTVTEAKKKRDGQNSFEFMAKPPSMMHKRTTVWNHSISAEAAYVVESMYNQDIAFYPVGSSDEDEDREMKAVSRHNNSEEDSSPSRHNCSSRSSSVGSCYSTDNAVGGKEKIKCRRKKGIKKISARGDNLSEQSSSDVENADHIVKYFNSFPDLPASMKQHGFYVPNVDLRYNRWKRRKSRKKAKGEQAENDGYSTSEEESKHKTNTSKKDVKNTGSTNLPTKSKSSKSQGRAQKQISTSRESIRPWSHTESENDEFMYGNKFTVVSGSRREANKNSRTDVAKKKNPSSSKDNTKVSAPSTSSPSLKSASASASKPEYRSSLPLRGRFLSQHKMCAKRASISNPNSSPDLQFGSLRRDRKDITTKHSLPGAHTKSSSQEKVVEKKSSKGSSKVPLPLLHEHWSLKMTDRNDGIQSSNSQLFPAFKATSCPWRTKTMQKAKQLVDSLPRIYMESSVMPKRSKHLNDKAPAVPVVLGDKLTPQAVLVYTQDSKLQNIRGHEKFRTSKKKIKLR